ncbi:MAG TPA: helix-turn-helix transcriptional regulator [Thermoanaerobaculia bacterium]|nr:helix-turn-helix transcriptional regulator [Thermoanaerobaculia bacterium]
MSAKKGSGELGRALKAARQILKRTQGEVADAAGRRESSISAIEQGDKQPSVETVARMAAALRISLADLGELAALIRRLRDGAGASGTAPAPLYDRARGDLGRAVGELLRAERGGLAEQPPAGAAGFAAACKAAPALLERLARHSRAGRLALVREAAEFHSSGLCVLLCEKSVEAASESATEAARLAGLGVLVARRVEGGERWRARLVGYALLHLANAVRVGGKLPLAEKTFARGAAQWLAGAAADPGLLNTARVLEIEASLRREKRDLAAAIALFDQALAADRWGETPSLLIGKAKALEELGNYEEAIGLLRQADSRLNRGRDGWRLFVVRTNLAVNLCHLGRHGEAEQLLPEIRSGAARQGKKLEAVRVRWLEGKVAAGLGRGEEALDLLHQVRGEFLVAGIAYDAALATLELAEVQASLGRTAEVKALARESAPVFAAQGVHREARAALALFCRAAEEEAASAAAVHRLIAYLYRARHDPELRFEAKDQPAARSGRRRGGSR